MNQEAPTSWHQAEQRRQHRTRARLDALGIDRLVSLPEAAMIVGIHRSTYVNWEAAGKAPRIRRINGKPRISLEELRAFTAEDSQPVSKDAM